MRAYAHMVAAAFVTAAGAAAWAGCGSSQNNESDQLTTGPDRDGRGGEYDNLASIDVTPSQVDLVAGDTNQSQAFQATGHFKDGSSRDLTNVVAWTVSTTNLLTMKGATATTTGARGGVATLTASVGPAAGAATVRVKWNKTVLAQGAPAGSEARFTGAADDPSLAPTLAYPFGGSLIPPNLPAMEIQFRPAAGTDIFDVGFVSATIDLHVITPCNAIGTTGGCGLALDKATWGAVTSTLAGDDPADVVVRGAGATAGKAGASSKSSIQLAKDDIRGGLYYFNTRPPPPGQPGIYRYDFAKDAAGPFYTAGACAGCHALSKDGTKMLAPICTPERGCGRPMQLAVVDVATKEVVTPPMPVGDSDTQTWSPDNRFYVTTPSCSAIDPAPPNGCTGFSNGAMTLIDAKTNTPVGPIPAGPGAMYPSFSNDGKKLVYARGGTYRGPLSIMQSSIFVLDFDGSQPTPTWSAEKALITASGQNFENNYHPSFSPDDAWVLFTRSHCEAGDDPNQPDIANTCDSYNDYTARTWVVSAAGGTAIELARANGEGRNIVSWPKWSPFKSTYKGGEIFWYTVSSVRDYGFRAFHNHGAQGNPVDGVQQLWLVAFDPKKAASGTDPSFAPVWLPFQDVTSSNHIGQWTEAIIGPVK